MAYSKKTPPIATSKRNVRSDSLQIKRPYRGKLQLTFARNSFLLVVHISRLKSGEDSLRPDEQKTADHHGCRKFHDAFPDMGRQHAEARLKEAIDRLWDRSVIIKNEEKNEKVPLGAVPGAVFQR